MFTSAKYLFHARKLVASVAACVGFVDQPDVLVPKLQRLLGTPRTMSIKGGSHLALLGWGTI